MPVHRCHFDALEATIAAIEADGEHVVSTASSGDSVAIVTYLPEGRRKAGGKETR